MNEIDNNEKQHSPHDEFFRNVFADVAIARDFLENYLPAPIFLKSVCVIFWIPDWISALSN
ncbi:MAG: Rpn family recombination-promoting nuclease/putative transposase [Acetobacterium sp.]|nr:Rpn family recombination-promoting nuclease/putative transposase [Acetobacterium sp.]